MKPKLEPSLKTKPSEEDLGITWSTCRTPLSLVRQSTSTRIGNNSTDESFQMEYVGQVSLQHLKYITNNVCQTVYNQRARDA